MPVDPRQPVRPALARCVVVAALLVTGCRHGDIAPVPPAPVAESSAVVGQAGEQTPAARTARSQGLDVLRSWDSRRSQAYAAGDVAALRRLYTTGSPLAEQDAAVLRRYRERGLQVARLRQQVISVEVHGAGARLVTMTVVERLARTPVRSSEPARRGAAQWELPASGFQRRLLRFERAGGAWRLSWARAA